MKMWKYLCEVVEVCEGRRRLPTWKLPVEGRKEGERNEACHDELMMPLMSMLLVPSLLILSVEGRKEGKGGKGN